ncbi:MAG: flagellar filament capping protein FliD [Candidatus Nitricoxidivorans perseverans]|uniref:Flagellar hook-associated protein 2 n=1 Tax=Candidatus Nitricoxidivorans perseverans TaxID=2975601 RepID=A0AA49FMN3_9PROT|nr:MAG: flagellar filament capping protein FliD [Candidatus Nitricoxidivorans perseverans]
MAGIASPGLGSGLDVSGLVSKLMALEQQPLTTLATKEASYQAKLTAFGSLKGALSSLQTAAKTLATTTTFTGMSASVSDTTVLTASAGTTAAAGSYSLSVTQLAKYHAVRSNTNYAATTDTFHTGTLAIQIGSGTAVNVTIDATNNTLAGIRDAINLANAGVTATILNDGTTNRLVLASKTSGSTGAITVAVTDSGSGGTNLLSDLASASLVTTQTADDANLTVNGIAITRTSNTITDAIDGVTLNLLKGTVASPGTATLTVAKNTGTITSAINAFVKAYNDAAKMLRDSSAYNAATKQASILTGDSTVRSMQSQLSTLVNANVTAITGGIARLSDIGIAVQKDGTLLADSTKLQAALGDTTKDVASLFTQTTAGNEGIAVRFNTALEGMVGSNGLISSRTDGINASIKDIGKRREALQLRLVQIEKRYRAQFTALDSLVASMQSTSTYLSQQLANLPGSSSS